MKPSALLPEFQLLLAGIQHPLQGSEGNRLRVACGVVTDWPKVITLADRHNVAALLYRNLRQHAAAEVPGDILAKFREQAEHTQQASLALMREQNQVAGWLAAAGLDLCPLKGPALSKRLYDDVGWRATGDLDVLVTQAALAPAEQLLLAQGYQRLEPPQALSPQARRHYQQLVHHTSYRHPERRICLELHHLIAEPYLIPASTTQQMLARAQAHTLMGAPLQMLTDEDTLAYLFIHGARHNWARLKWLADVAALAHRAANLDWVQVKRILTEAGWQRVLGQGALLANQLLDLPIPLPAQAVITDTLAAKRLAQGSLQALLASSDYTSTPGRWHRLRHLFYLIQLNPDPRYQLRLLTTVRFNYAAWHIRSRSMQLQG